MKVIDLLNKIANGEEVPKKFRFNYRTYELKQKYRYEDIEDGKIFEERLCLEFLNDEIEIIEQETTYEQNFTGWKLIQNGKVIASYGYAEPALKPVDVVDVEKDIKKMLEENPKKIEKIELDSEENIIYYEDGEKHRFNTNKQNKYFAHKIIELQETVNYLLEKESDK